MPSVITANETWVFRYALKTKQLSSQRQAALFFQQKKAWHVNSGMKTMFITFCNILSFTKAKVVLPDNWFGFSTTSSCILSVPPSSDSYVNFVWKWLFLDSWSMFKMIQMDGFNMHDCHSFKHVIFTNYQFILKDDVRVCDKMCDTSNVI